MEQPEIISFEQESYKSLCEDLRDVLSFEKELKQKKEELRSKILEMSGGDRMEYGIKVSSHTKKGSIDWEKLAKDNLKKELVELVKDSYKKEDQTVWKVISY